MQVIVIEHKRTVDGAKVTYNQLQYTFANATEALRGVMLLSKDYAAARAQLDQIAEELLNPQPPKKPSTAEAKPKPAGEKPGETKPVKDKE